MRPLRLRVVTLAMVIASATACAAVADGDPSPLPPAAAELLQERLREFGEPRPDGLFGPGNVDLADGTRLPYDRYLLVGSQLGSDRGASFGRFLQELRERGGTYRVLVADSGGNPTKVLLVCDGRRIVAAVQQW